MRAEEKPNPEHSNPANWHYGFYYAPNDPNVIVARRGGWEYGSTINFARPQAYLLLLTPLVLGAIICACVFLFGR